MLEGITIANGGPVALLGLFIVAILRGWLVPRRVLQDTQADRDEWRKIALEREDWQRRVLFPVAETTTRVLDGLPKVPTEESP